MKKSIVLIDGGHLRARARNAKRNYDPEFIDAFARKCISADEELFRILYYDCAPFSGTVKLPVSGQDREFKANDGWLRDLGQRELFALRLGELKFRGFNPKRVPIAPSTVSDADFDPVFEQKGVDMRIGLDIATNADERNAERFILVTADTDCIPAMKHARRKGAQIVLILVDGHRAVESLRRHSDFVRSVTWP